MNYHQRRHAEELAYNEWLVARQSEMVDDLGILAILAVSAGTLSTSYVLDRSTIPNKHVAEAQINRPESSLRRYGASPVAQLVRLETHTATPTKDSYLGYGQIAA